MRTSLLALVAIAPLAACALEETVEVEPCVDCALTDANNFSYTTDLAIGSLVLPEHADATVSWAGLTRDVRGGALDPVADIDEARLIGFRDLPPEDVAWGLAHDELEQSDVSVYVTCVPTEATCELSEFGMFGNQIDIQQYFSDGYGTWLLTLGRSGEPGADVLAFLAPDADAITSLVTIDDRTSRLDVAVHLDELTPLAMLGGDPTVTVDWSALTHDGLGDPLDTSTVDELWVARFEEPIETLAEDVFALEEMAQASWTLAVDGRTDAALAELAGESAFHGIDRAGTWLLALRCRTCTNPAPRFITILSAD